eukprot:GEMP01021639.1.p1 GENE.GEMP01021639.1~~GEMP01021639.1.p1  ORF type:complete len:700 (+),score=113.65 GEMP01021639.1:95-2194(+)
MPGRSSRRPGTVPARKLTPGITILVHFQAPACDGKGGVKGKRGKNSKHCWDDKRWVDIILQESGNTDRLFCETTRQRDRETFAFWFSPSAVTRGQDDIVERFELGDEPEEKEELREDEVRRLHKAFAQPDLRLNNRQVKRFPGFITQPSQYFAKATILDTNASSEKRDEVEQRMETLMMLAAGSREMRNEINSMSEFDQVAAMAKLLSKSNMTREEWAASFTKPKEKPVLIPFHIYQCFAELECINCTHSWDTIRAWGVYDPQSNNCDCEESKKSIVGCVHVLKDPWECKQDSKDEHVFVPVMFAQQPRQGCRHCGDEKRATKCEVVWDHKYRGHHIPEHCPECRRLKKWCRGTAHHEDILSRLVVAAEFIKESGLDWKPSPAGLEAETVVNGVRILFQIRPWLFMLRANQSETEHQPHTLTGREPDLLRGDRMVVGSSELQLLKRALRGVNAQFSPSHDIGQNFDTSTAQMGCRLSGKWRAYSFNGIVDYGARDGVVYYKPSGWVRKRLNLSAEILERIRPWPMLWHGTTEEKSASVIFSSLHRPGSCGVNISHGQAGSATDRTIYLSPSLGYASHPVYAQFFEVDCDRWAQIVLQCKARPGTWRARHSTLGPLRHWPPEVRIDPNFENHDEMEYLFEDANDIVVFGLMYREFGPAASRSLYGDLVTQVHNRTRAPEYCWTELLEADHRAKGLLTAQA